MAAARRKKTEARIEAEKAQKEALLQQRPAPRKATLEELRTVRMGPVANVIGSDIAILVRGLQRRHGQRNVETATSVILDMLRFHRLPHEHVDGTLSRCESLCQRTAYAAQGF